MARGWEIARRNCGAAPIVHEEDPSRTGSSLGSSLPHSTRLTKPSAMETEALSRAAGLAALAIETRRLYSDLLHRSEFDLLTDIHNRFSLEKRMDAQIEEARADGQHLRPDLHRPGQVQAGE